jgi:hypothetical protein
MPQLSLTTSSTSAAISATPSRRRCRLEFSCTAQVSVAAVGNHHVDVGQQYIVRDAFRDIGIHRQPVPELRRVAAARRRDHGDVHDRPSTVELRSRRRSGRV